MSYFFTWSELRPRLVALAVVHLHFGDLDVVVELDDLLLFKLLNGRPKAQLKQAVYINFLPEER